MKKIKNLINIFHVHKYNLLYKDVRKSHEFEYIPLWDFIIVRNF